MTHVVFEREPGAPANPAPFSMPRPVGRALIALALFTVGIATYSSVTGRTAALAPLAPAIAMRDLVLRDVPATGGAEVVDARTGDRLATFANADSARFLRTMLRGLGTHVDPRDARLEVRFTIAFREDGQLTISRAGSPRVNALNGFGAQQVAALQELLRRR